MYNQQYALSAQARTLLGESSNNLSKKITYDNKAQLYQFNKDAKKDSASEGNPLAKLQSQVGGAGKEDAQQHSIDLPRNLSKGITYYDNQMELSFKLVPEFTAKLGGLKEGHLIYPLTGAKGQVAYTVTNSGLKENIILYKSPGDTFKTSYFLDLPKSLEARLIPETGEIGVYSADPTLFGNISYGSSDDESRVENARNNSEKTYLTFKIPAPVVTGLNGNDQSTVAPVKSKFTLHNSTLTVTTTGLEKADYPLAIDPSVSIDSTTDFRTGNQEDNNSTISSGSLSRSGISGGTVGGWTNNSTDMPASIFYHSSVAYNGYLYTVAGTSVRYAPISSDGSVGSWTSATTLTGGEYYAAATVYNGYLYVSGGGASPGASVRYAKISSNGSLGSWASATNLPSGRSGHQAIAYNGYMYVIGGLDSTTNPSTQTFNATGGQQTYTVPAGVTSISVDVRGGRGQTTTVAGGNGGRVQATMTVTPGQTLYVYAGGAGVTNGSSFNGGGIGYNSGGGGGASDIRQGGTALGDRVVVAGGGGGGGANGIPQVGGAGGGLTGADGGVAGNHPSGWGGTPSAGGAGGTSAATCVGGNGSAGVLGIGGNGLSGSYGGGGGGGYYGGGGGTCTVSGGQVFVGGGGGGSSYAAPSVTDITHTQGYQTSAGQVIITAQVPTLTNNVQYAPINADGTLGSWTSTASFTNARAYHQAVAYNGYMYLLGGQSGATLYNDVQYAQINADGTLGSWTSTASFTTARSYHSAVVSQGHIYILGGNTSNLNDVQYARINTDGSLGGWNTTTAFNTGRYGHTSVAYDGYIYVIGGVGAGDKIQYASINPPGATSTYSPTASFATARHVHSSVAYNGYMYIIGGADTGAPLTDIQYAPINTNGTIGAWVTNPTPLPSSRVAHASVAYNGYMYIIGGLVGGNWSASVQYAPINTNGTLGSWNNVNSFTTARAYHSSVVYDGYLYVLGGLNTSTYYDTVQYARINSNGSLGPWAPLNTFSGTRHAASAVAYGGYMYILGGANASTTYSDIQYALICTGANSGSGGCNATAGTIGTWSSAGSLSAPRAYPGATVSNGLLYVAGGTSGTQLDITQVAKINSSGTIGTWTSANSFTTARIGHASVIYNGYLYIIGGNKPSSGTACLSTGSSNLCNDVQYTQISNGGGGAARTWTSGTSFTNARHNHATVAYKGYLYIIGGFNGPSTYYADVQKAPILESGGIGAWASGGSNLPSSRSGAAAVAYKGYMYVLGGINVGGFLNEVQRASIDPSTGMLGSWSPDTSFAGARHAAAAVVNNGYIYILGGNDAGPQTATFNYTGSQQTYTVPAGVTSVKVAATGADGGGIGYYGSDVGGSGSHIEANLSVTPSETLYIQVGGNGSTNNGYNGGGASGDGGSGTGDYYRGGGASDVRQGGTALANRKVIAGGGGGAGGSLGGYSTYGGGGGTFTNSSNGGDAGTGVCAPGMGATNAAGGLGGWVAPIGDTEEAGATGVLGAGGKGGNNIGGGGGGGYYGGGGGGGWLAFAGCGGGGGTSYVGSGTSNAIASPGYDQSASGTNGQISITYGKAAYNDVQYAQINSNGTLGSWASTTSMNQDRTLHAATVVNGYLYAVGGSSSMNVHRAVEYAPINPNGTVGTWSQANGMSSVRQGLSLAVVNGYMYAVGGNSGAAFLSSVEYAPINANGTLGNWQVTQSMGSIRSSEGKSATSYNGRLYAVGGYNGSSALNTTEYTSLQSTPRKFSYSKLIDLGTASNVTGLSFVGNAQVSQDNLRLRYKVANSSGVFGAYKLNGSFSCAEGDSGRYVQIFVTLDDEQIGTFRDEDGLRSVLDSITVDYVPFAAPTEKRMRHGAFFQNGTLRAFNTNNAQCSI